MFSKSPSLSSSLSRFCKAIPWRGATILLLVTLLMLPAPLYLRTQAAQQLTQYKLTIARPMKSSATFRHRCCL
ncbi:MAG: hypothetical protein U0Y68_25840 [Blastocatellia bacterium]